MMNGNDSMRDERVVLWVNDSRLTPTAYQTGGVDWRGSCHVLPNFCLLEPRIFLFCHYNLKIVFLRVDSL